MSRRVSGTERLGVVPLPSLRARTVKRDDVRIYEVECPQCGRWGEVDDDQWNGRVSIMCSDDDPTISGVIQQGDGCGWHGTINLQAEWVAYLDPPHGDVS